MNPKLSEGVIAEIMNGGTPDKPILQILGQKKMAASGNNIDRYRVLLSDGRHSHSSALLATQLNSKVTKGELDTFTVVQLNKFMCNTLPTGKSILILLDVDVLAAGHTVASRIGNPQPYKIPEQGEAPSNEAAAARPPANGDNKPANTFYNKPQSTDRKPYSIQNQSVAAKPIGGTPSKVHPIDSLTPYQNRWTIRARVTSKSNIRTWSNSRGEGKLFSMSFLDDSGEIRATAFKAEVDKFYDFIELNKVYYVSKAQLKTADKRYSSLANDYEMTFNSETQVIPCEEEVDLPTIKYNFVPISKLADLAANSTLDVIGVVRSVSELSKVIGRASQKEVTKREIMLVDEGQVQVRMTLWSSDAENFDGSANPVFAIKGCRLSDWGGRSLSALSRYARRRDAAQSQIIMNPDVPEAHKLRGWYDDVGHNMDYSEFQGDGSQGGAGGHATNWKTFLEATQQNLGQEKPEYFTTKATIAFVKRENCMYMACPSDSCNKKVVDLANGTYRCEKCNKEYPNYQWRLILSANLSDYTGQQWVTFFQETAECILGRSAEEIGQLRESDDVQFEQLFQEVTYKSFIFKLRAKMETYNDESRMKTICVEAAPINIQTFNKKLIEEIENMLTG